ncbi:MULTISPECIES: trehalose-phosphatase [unclassified Coleofasciculus]|uniref:trehalose-phosphatase n=1 Tax=unclassified Coleofasciculus TaxID=2692782 RepID=UPI0018816E51|nr:MULTISPECIES: trehalose-phosphatase [unclassified Coleofasciculus]MBE9129408.1 trehalose-phosphatase [Coleofasciculus sp. LEGE 07081]MBE9152047.1 trehalose-phosphatase [Coleofasciculus sp. LEGE 07092]
MNNNPYKAAILDLDGVITQTARLHARAWKQMFDDYLQQHSEGEGENHTPFDIDADYNKYVDGKPRYDGVRSFLASRGIELPQGNPDDPPGKETICGLGNRKNEIFLNLLHKEGVETYADAVEQIRRWRKQGIKSAVVSSSRNCEAILETAGLKNLFDAKVDGVDSERLNLKGKPAPDIFLEAAQQLAVEPEQAIIVEDAISGVEAGRAGQFGRVVGMAREGDGEALRQHGADVVVQSLRDISMRGEEHSATTPPRSALEYFHSIETRLSDCDLALFIDYDGTLTPIVKRPEEAALSEEMRSLLRQLSLRVTVGIISGRDLRDVQTLVGLENLYYAGSHGFDIAGPDDMREQQEEAQASLPDLDDAESQLRDRLEPLAGAHVERKHFAVAVHYREATEQDIDRIESIVDEVLNEHQQLRKRGGKKIFELQPDVPWDKGYAVCWLLDQLGLNQPNVLPMYLGDDTTDEDAFQALSDRGVGIRIGEPHEPTQANYILQNPDEVKQFFQALLKKLNERNLDRD